MRLIHAPLALAVLSCASGCARDRALAHAVPPHGLTVTVHSEITGATEPSYRSVTGESARTHGADGGLIGLMITSVVRSASESDNQRHVRSWSSSGCDERELLRAALAGQMHEAGFYVTNDVGASPARLQLKLQEFGLREVQRESAVPFATVSAKLLRADGTAFWSATAQSCGLERKRIDEYSPEAYRAAFIPVANDLAAQLIRGPIRPIETHSP
jgi:hypothetical protein